MPLPEKAHIQQIDYIRAIASIVVALFHFGGKVLPVLRYGYLGVDMFFVLSGFIICWAIPADYDFNKAIKFVGRRITRIEPPYIISIILAIGGHFFFVKNFVPDGQNIVFHLAYINSFLGKPYLNPVYWSLAIEFQFYIFVAIFFVFLSKRWSPILLILISVAGFIIWVPGDNLFNIFPLFAIGILYFLYRKQTIGRLEAIIYAFVLILCSVLKLGIPTTSAAVVAVLIILLPLKSNSIIAFLSKISFSLYLTHDITGSNLIAYMGMVLPKSIAFKGIEFLSGIIISIAFAYLFYLLVEAPCLKLSKRIKYK